MGLAVSPGADIGGARWWNDDAGGSVAGLEPARSSCNRAWLCPVNSWI